MNDADEEEDDGPPFPRLPRVTVEEEVEFYTTDDGEEDGGGGAKEEKAVTVETVVEAVDTFEVLGGTTTATEGEEDSASFSSSQEKDFDQARALPRRTKIDFALIEMDFLL